MLPETYLKCCKQLWFNFTTIVTCGSLAVALRAWLGDTEIGLTPQYILIFMATYVGMSPFVAYFMCKYNNREKILK